MEEPIRSQGSFIDCSRLYMAQGVLVGFRLVSEDFKTNSSSNSTDGGLVRYLPGS